MNGHRHRRSMDIRTVVVGLALALAFSVVDSQRVLFIDLDHELCNLFPVWCEKMASGHRPLHLLGLSFSLIRWCLSCALLTGLCAWEWMVREKPTQAERSIAVIVGWVSVLVLIVFSAVGGVAYLVWEFRWLLPLMRAISVR